MLSYLTLSAAGFLAGAYLKDCFSFLGISELLTLSAVVWGILCLIFGKYRAKLTVSALFLALGIIGCGIASDYGQNTLCPLEEKYVTLDGYICDLPEQYGELYSYRLKLCRAQYSGKEYKTSQTVRVSSYEKFNFGDEIQVKGFLKRFSDKNNSTDFNIRRYYQSRGIFYRLYAREAVPAETGADKLSFGYAVTYLRAALSDIINSEFSGDDAAILNAVAIGNKHDFSPSYKNILLRTGMMKYFYSSFFHTSLISFIIGIIFAKCRKSIREVILALSMILYAAANSASPVFVKCAVVVLLTLICRKRLGFSHKPDILALTILAVGMANPLYCFDVGFVMSVTCSIMFYYFYDLLSDKLRFLRFGKGFASFYIITTVAMLPATAYFFDGIAPYTNLFAPVFSLAAGLLIFLIPAMAVCTKLLGSAVFLKKIISLLILPFSKLPYITDSLPGSFIYLKTPNAAVMIAAFIVIYIIHRLMCGQMKKQYNKYIAVACLGIICGIGANRLLSNGRMDITFVNVEQGDGVVIDIIGGETVLIDGGGKYEFSDYDAGENIFLPYLADNGYTDIDAAIISHYHSDHALGIIAALKTLTVHKIIMPDTDSENENRIEIERLAAEKDIPIYFVSAGNIINLKSGAYFTVLSPDAENLQLDENESSIVVKLSYNGFNCLFTGDIGAKTEKKIQNKVGDCNIVKMAHHGSAKSNTAEFAEAVSAEYAIASVGENNIYGFPKKQAVYNYQSNGTKVVTTVANGDITVSVRPDGSYKIFKKER